MEEIQVEKTSIRNNYSITFYLCIIVVLLELACMIIFSFLVTFL